MQQLDLLKRVKEKTLERIISKYGQAPGTDLKDSKLSILDARDIIYQEVDKIAKELFNKDFPRSDLR